MAMALPMLDAMRPAFAASGKADVPRRMVAVQTNMGILPQFFFPEQGGKDYALSPYLKRLEKVRDQFTVFSGVSHPGVAGGHAAERCFLTGTPHPERGGFRNWVSIDQFAAEQIGNRTRYPSLVLGCGNEGQTLSYTRSGAPIPIERSPRKLFEKLFVTGKPSEVAAQLEELRQGRSTLDFVNDQAKRLNASLSPADRRRLDQYMTAVRDLEERLHSAEAWEHKPKPKVTAAPPEDIKDGREFAKQTKVMFDVIRLALETDSSRLVSVFVDTTVIHNITHHGGRPEVFERAAGQGGRPVRRVGRFPEQFGRREGGRRYAPRPDDGAVRHLHGQRQFALEPESARVTRRRRLPARATPAVRRQEQLSADELVRVDAPAPRHRGERILDRQGDVPGVGDGLNKNVSRKDAEMQRRQKEKLAWRRYCAYLFWETMS